MYKSCLAFIYIYLAFKEISKYPFFCLRFCHIHYNLVFVAKTSWSNFYVLFASIFNLHIYIFDLWLVQRYYFFGIIVSYINFLSVYIVCMFCSLFILFIVYFFIN